MVGVTFDQVPLGLGLLAIALLDFGMIMWSRKLTLRQWGILTATNVVLVINVLLNTARF